MPKNAEKRKESHAENVYKTISIKASAKIAAHNIKKADKRRQIVLEQLENNTAMAIKDLDKPFVVEPLKPEGLTAKDALARCILSGKSPAACQALIDKCMAKTDPAEIQACLKAASEGRAAAITEAEALAACMKTGKSEAECKALIAKCKALTDPDEVQACLLRAAEGKENLLTEAEALAACMKTGKSEAECKALIAKCNAMKDPAAVQACLRAAALGKEAAMTEAEALAACMKTGKSEAECMALIAKCKALSEPAEIQACLKKAAEGKENTLTAAEALAACMKIPKSRPECQALIDKCMAMTEPAEIKACLKNAAAGKATRVGLTYAKHDGPCVVAEPLKNDPNKLVFKNTCQESWMSFDFQATGGEGGRELKLTGTKWELLPNQVSQVIGASVGTIVAEREFSHLLREPKSVNIDGCVTAKLNSVQDCIIQNTCSYPIKMATPHGALHHVFVAGQYVTGPAILCTPNPLYSYGHPKDALGEPGADVKDKAPEPEETKEERDEKESADDEDEGKGVDESVKPPLWTTTPEGKEAKEDEGKEAAKEGKEEGKEEDASGKPGAAEGKDGKEGKEGKEAEAPGAGEFDDAEAKEAKEDETKEAEEAESAAMRFARVGGLTHPLTNTYRLAASLSTARRGTGSGSLRFKAVRAPATELVTDKEEREDIAYHDQRGQIQDQMEKSAAANAGTSIDWASLLKGQAEREAKALAANASARPNNIDYYDAL